MRLGVVLSDQLGCEAEAEEAFREAIKRGSLFSKVLLASLLLNSARLDEAYKLLKKLKGMGVSGVSELLSAAGNNQIVQLTQVRTPEDIYRAAKKIDGDPRPGSYQIAALRVIAHYGF